jgi:hypothetical protein
VFGAAHDVSVMMMSSSVSFMAFVSPLRLGVDFRAV